MEQDIVKSLIVEAESLPQDTKLIEIGEWYWVKGDEDDLKYHREFLNENDEMLMCVVHIGTNYAQLSAPGGRHDNLTQRIYFNEFGDKCRLEIDHVPILQSKVAQCRETSKTLMLEVKRVTAQLGVGNREQLPGESGSSALVAISGQSNVTNHKAELIKAKEETLPDLFRKLKASNELMATWMKAEVIPLQAQAGALTALTGKINDRIFNVEIYAGLTEKIVTVLDGEPADVREKLHVMQRRHYMDEECLLQYETGGMDFNSIREFDDWMKDHYERLLPFERCMIAFRIRRHVKDRGNLHWFIKMQYEEADKITFMYIRNGKKLYRMNTSLDFGHRIFPTNKEFDPAKLRWDRSHFITEDDWRVRGKQERRRERRHEAWIRKNPGARHWDSPHRAFHTFKSSRWHKFSPESVYYDDMTKQIEDEMNTFNRISLIIQGLFDRSPVFDPHPPVQLWDGGSFERNIKLVFDQDMAITPGDKPDWSAYIEKTREHIKVGSVTIGQLDDWYGQQEGKKTVYGNCGPARLATVTKHTRTGKSTFKWTRDRQTAQFDWRGRYLGYGDPISCSCVVPDSELFCVDGYKKGDYKQFFADPRTREEYLKWAPLMLAAEEYLAGNLTPDDHTHSRFHF